MARERGHPPAIMDNWKFTEGEEIFELAALLQKALEQADDLNLPLVAIHLSAAIQRMQREIGLHCQRK